VLCHGHRVRKDTVERGLFGNYFLAVNEFIRMPNGASPKEIKIPRLKTAQDQVGKARAA
jgi:hypothetical protein